MSHVAWQVRRIGDDIVAGFAGSTADCFTLMERLERKLEEHPGQLTRACVDLAKAWRTDKYLRRLEVKRPTFRRSSFLLTIKGHCLMILPLKYSPFCPRLQASLLVADASVSFEITGLGDVLEPNDGVIAIGSGGTYALGKPMPSCTRS